MPRGRIRRVVAWRLGKRESMCTYEGRTFTVYVHPVPPDWSPDLDVPDGAAITHAKVLTRAERDALFDSGACEVTILCETLDTVFLDSEED